MRAIAKVKIAVAIFIQREAILSRDGTFAYSIQKRPDFQIGPLLIL